MSSATRYTVEVRMRNLQQVLDLVIPPHAAHDVQQTTVVNASTTEFTVTIVSKWTVENKVGGPPWIRPVVKFQHNPE